MGKTWRRNRKRAKPASVARSASRAELSPRDAPAAPSVPAPADDDKSRSPERGSALQSVRIEDVLLFLWIVLAERLVEGLFGLDLQPLTSLGSAPKWAYAAVFGGLAVAFYTRGPADSDLNEATSRRCFLGLFGWFVARDYFSGSPDWGMKAIVVGMIVVVLVAPLQNLERLPRTSFGLRRILVLPAQLAGNSVFSSMITPEFVRGTELQGVAPDHRWFASLVLAAFLFLYIVIAPRVLAGESWQPLAWVIRFGFFATALWLGHPSWLAYGW